MNVIPMRVELPCNAHESAVGDVDSDIGTFTDSVDDDDDDDDDEPDDAEDDSAAASTEEVEALLAREWNQLTLQEREAINEEVHGVRDEYRDVVDKETPELLHGSLRQLALELDAIPKKPAYHTCQTEYGATTWVNTAEFRLLFLRCEFFDAKKAAARIVAFLELSRSCWGDFVLEREVCLSDLSEQDRVLLDSGLLQMLPGRDRCGRRVLIHFTHNNVGPTRPKESRMRVALYLALKVVKHDVDLQRSGMVLISWIHDNLFNDFRVRSHVCKNLMLVIPCRISVVHVHISPPDGAYRSFANIAKEIFLLAIGSKLRKRVRIHLGSDTDFLYYIQTFGIQSSQIPLDSTTGQRKTANHHEWIEQLEFREHHARHGKEFTGIECPRHSDVLYGKGSRALSRQHPGNACFRNLMEQRMDDYNTATERGSKILIASSVVTDLQKSHGSRFLRKDKHNGFWYEVSNVEARDKVSVGFRDMRKAKAGTTNVNTEPNSMWQSRTNRNNNRC